MLIVHTDKHRLHNPKRYFAMGRMDPYPEQPSRIETILQELKHRNLGKFIQPLDFGLNAILQVHSLDYVEYVSHAFEEWIKKGGDENGVIPDTFAVHVTGIYRDISLASDNILAKMGIYTFDAATVIAKDTYVAAYEASQCALTAAKRLMDDGLTSTFALCRPPGHHSSSELLGGFCFFNNAAIATQYLINQHQKRVAILDIDYHHGNGTQGVFYEQENPLFVSLHDRDSDPYYWGDERHTGVGAGEGFNVNVCLPSGTEDDIYLATLKKTILNHIMTYEPDVLVISLGVDTFKDDPVGTFQLTSDAFVEIGKLIRMVGVPTLFVMEGGYDCPELGVNVCNVLQGFENGTSAVDL